MRVKMQDVQIRILSDGSSYRAKSHEVLSAQQKRALVVGKDGISPFLYGCKSGFGIAEGQFEVS